MAEALRISEGRMEGIGTPSMSDAEFQTIARLLYEESGIALGESKTALVYSRLARRLRALGMRNFADYCALVSGPDGAAERHEMLTALTTNVTHFFREKHHFEHLRSILPPLLESARRGESVRIWSAGCSNGHEPYSIALTILSLMPDAASRDIRILASDIDPNVVSFGRAGIYDDASLEPVPKAFRSRWFAPVSNPGPRAMGAQFEVAPELRQLVSFRELNLIGDWPMRRRFDLIFCRNVTIYFDAPTRERIWARFADMLKPSGVLYLGHSERLAGAAADRFSLEGTTTYRLRGGAAR